MSSNAERGGVPSEKRRELSDEEKEAIRFQIEQGHGDVYHLAKEFGCVPVQIAGIKANMNR
jgi:hypothetical protein